MSRILIEEDETGEAYLVDYWISSKNNLCWKHNGKIYVKLRSGYIMMTEENQSNWIPGDCHTAAKTAEVAALSKPQYNTEPWRFIG